MFTASFCRSIRSSRVYLGCVRNTSSEGIHLIKMPGIMNSKEGTVKRWAVKVGDKFREGDILCDITLPVATIGIDAKDDGIIAKIVVDEYETAPAESVIAMYAISEQYYMNFLAETMQETADAAKLADVAEAAAAEEKQQQQQQQEQQKPDAKTLMRVIKQMVQHGSIESGSAFAKKLQSLARKGDPELLAAFEASYEGAAFNQETFDEKFFLENAHDIVEEGEDTD